VDIRSETGQTTTEYAFVLALVVLVLATAVVAMNLPFADLVSRLATTITGG
jgi:hypothetical protein